MFHSLRAAVALAAASFVLAAPSAAADLTLDFESGFTVPVELRGRTVRLRVDLEAPGHPILNPAAAEALGFRGSLFGARAAIGPVRIPGRTNGARYRVGGTELRHRFVWFDRPLVEGADGIVSPHDLPYDRIVFRLRPPLAGETRTVLAMDFDRSSGLFHPLAVGGQTVRLQFSTLQPLSLATASAGAHIGGLLGGAWDGEGREAPIEFGVSRPVRPMRLARALDVQGFRLDSLLVRTRDHRGSFELPADPSDDPDEVVVTGASRQRARLGLTVGMDRLSRCSSIEYDRTARRLTLNCAP